MPTPYEFLQVAMIHVAILSASAMLGLPFYVLVKYIKLEIATRAVVKAMRAAEARRWELEESRRLMREAGEKAARESEIDRKRQAYVDRHTPCNLVFIAPSDPFIAQARGEIDGMIEDVEGWK